MTGTAPSHLDLDALADALAGEGDADSSAHLASCASCTSRLGELQAAEAGLVASLQQLPDPPLPDGLAERLTAALAAEPPLRAPGGSVTALPARAPRRRLLPAAAAAVLLVSGGGLGYALVQGGAGGNDSASEAVGGLAAPPTSSTGTDYGDPAAVTGALPLLLSGGAAAAGGTAVTDSEMRTESQDQPPPEDTAAMTAAAEDPLARLRTPEGLQECLSGVLPPEEPDVQPLALDYASFQGQPALAVVLPDPDPAKLSVYVVGPECAQADAQVLTFLRVDRP